MKRALVSAAALVAVATGCGSATPTGTAGPTPPFHSSTAPTATRTSCPNGSPGSAGGHMAIDFVDFVQAFGHQYLSGLWDKEAGPITRAELGAVVLVSKCSFSEYNDRTQLSPGDPEDGDTAFLPPGTPVYAVKGWSPQCRLAAVHEGTLRTYLATANGGTTARPRACALRH